MVFSVRANKKRIFAALAVLGLIICGIIILPKLISEPVKYYGETAAERKTFLESFGWTVSEEPLDSREVMIPTEFSEVYEKYNDMQRAQGFDIRPYKGKACRQYIYLVNNYPDSDREIHATLLVYNGLIIGGDISCAEVDGFMHGFAADSTPYGGTVSSEAEESTSEASIESNTESSEVTSTESSAGSEAETPTDAEIAEDAYPTD